MTPTDQDEYRERHQSARERYRAGVLEARRLGHLQCDHKTDLTAEGLCVRCWDAGLMPMCGGQRIYPEPEPTRAEPAAPEPRAAPKPLPTKLTDKALRTADQVDLEAWLVAMRRAGQDARARKVEATLAKRFGVEVKPEPNETPEEGEGAAQRPSLASAPNPGPGGQETGEGSQPRAGLRTYTAEAGSASAEPLPLAEPAAASPADAVPQPGAGGAPLPSGRCVYCDAPATSEVQEPHPPLAPGAYAIAGARPRRVRERPWLAACDACADLVEAGETLERHAAKAAAPMEEREAQAGPGVATSAPASGFESPAPPPIADELQQVDELARGLDDSDLWATREGALEGYVELNRVAATQEAIHALNEKVDGIRDRLKTVSAVEHRLTAVEKRANAAQATARALEGALDAAGQATVAELERFRKELAAASKCFEGMAEAINSQAERLLRLEAKLSAAAPTSDAPAADANALAAALKRIDHLERVVHVLAGPARERERVEAKAQAIATREARAHPPRAPAPTADLEDIVI